MLGQIRRDRANSFCLNQIDFRVGKILKYGRMKAVVNLDLFNVTNASPVLTLNTNFGPSYLTPLNVLPSRFAKISGTFDF